VNQEKCNVCDHVTKPFYAKCPRCEGNRNRDVGDRLRDVIVELKESVRYDLDPQRERELLKDLVTLGHPDPQGFIAWIAEQKRNPQPKQRSQYRRAA
jgi:hypothetical protein